MQTLITIEEAIANFDNIVIKSYLPYPIKKTIITNLLEACIIEQEGIKRIDYSLLEVVKCFALVNNYTNLNLSDLDILDAYDQLQESNLAKDILKNIPSTELEFYEKVISAEIEQIHRIENSLENVISQALDKLIAKLPNAKEINKMLPKLGKEIAKISPETLEILKKVNK